ncbi:hypothetical protein J3A64_001742 [Pseudarthrobacter sp. PvP004]|nr:hypothetical protein [Pseudarthrobacter sp. PvP004]
MAASSRDKDDLSVDNVHTPFGLTKRPPGKSPQRQERVEPWTFDDEPRSHVALGPPPHEQV